jgi:glycosyltransferase involved in cell wall biosynthesis
MPSISLVVPAYNEEGGLEQTVNRCLHTLRQCADDYEIVILDDCSQDRTPEIMERIRQKDPGHIRTMRHATNKGIAATFEDLYKAATKEYLFLTPADGEYPPEALLDCVKLLPECDIVVCHRQYKHYTAYRHLVSLGYRWFTVLLFGADLYDPGSTKLIRRSLITDIPVTSKSVYVEAERVIRAVRMGYKVGKVNIVQENRKGGKARGAKVETVWLAASDMVRLWWELIVLRKA